MVQPFLRPVDEPHRVLLRGRFEIREAESVWEAFALDIELPRDERQGLPTVWEIGGRIPKVSDPHHVNSDTETLCVCLPEAYWYYHPEGLSLAEFLEGPLRTHLAGQALVLRGHPWPAGEWAHDTEGRLQFFQHVFGTPDRKSTLEFLRVTCHTGVKGHWPCPCGSGERLRDCHGEVVFKMNRSKAIIPWRKAFQELEREEKSGNARRKGGRRRRKR